MEGKRHAIRRQDRPSFHPEGLTMKTITVQPDSYDTAKFTVAVHPNSQQAFHTPVLTREELVAMRDAIDATLKATGRASTSPAATDQHYEKEEDHIRPED